MDPVSDPTMPDAVSEVVPEPLVIGSVGDSRMLEGSMEARPVEPPSLLVEVCVLRELPSVAPEPLSLLVSEPPPSVPSEDLA